MILIQPRVHVVNDADLPSAQKVLNDITITGMAQYLGQTPASLSSYNFIKPELANPKLPVSAVDFKDPMQFWQILSAAINENPPPKDQISALLPMFKPLGIEFGKQWDATKISPIILESMKRAARDIGPLNSNLPLGRFANGWFIPPPDIEMRKPIIIYGPSSHVLD